MLTVKHSSSTKCVLARFLEQLSAHFRFVVQHSYRPVTGVTRPLCKRKIASEIILFALESLFDTSRIQKSQHLRLFNAALAVFQSSDAQDGMRH